MSNPFSVAQKYLQSDEHKPLAPPTTNPTEGRIVAVLIDSPIVGPVWFALDDDFKSGDDIPVFYASELPHLQKMSEAELRKRYEQKLALGGGWIRDRVEEPTKH
jgi:hypothetical protein